MLAYSPKRALDSTPNCAHCGRSNKPDATGPQTRAPRASGLGIASLYDGPMTDLEGKAAVPEEIAIALPAAPVPEPGPARKFAMIVPLVVATALFMENLDSTVISTSLPAIALDLHEDPVALKLALTAYLVVREKCVSAPGVRLSDNDLAC